MLKDVGGSWRVVHSRTHTEVVTYKAHEPHEGCSGNLVVATVDGNPDVRKAIGDLIACAPSMLALFEKAYPIIEEEAERRGSWGERHNTQQHQYATEMSELRDAISAEIDRAYGREGKSDG